MTDPETSALSHVASTWPAALTSDAAYAARARFNARLAARDCCRAVGTTCHKCRVQEIGSPRWRNRLRDLRDVLQAWWAA